MNREKYLEKQVELLLEIVSVGEGCPEAPGLFHLHLKEDCGGQPCKACWRQAVENKAKEEEN